MSMRRLYIVFTLVVMLLEVNAQTVNDFFKNNETKITWLGIDYSHVKLIGDFAQFSNAGKNNYIDIKQKYFPAWNNIILKEKQKYDVKGMINRSEISYNLHDIKILNENADVFGMEAYDNPNYTKEDIAKFVSEYKFTQAGEGIAILFIAEALNKNDNIAIYHFIAINVKTNEVLINERMSGKPGGFGVKNYWARSIYETINEIKRNYMPWGNKYLNK